ncbi:MAG: glycosyltransferase family 4 protein [Candidatus Staskawiczbacteria bacterium]|nr:glycosyltransferase family 4 protein [Candidatus Staskawiczbacteria bacterium]
MKVLTNIRFAQTAGIAQVVLAFMDFIEKSKKGDINVVAVNIINQKDKIYRKCSNKKTCTISMGINVPNIAKIVEKAKTLADVEKKLEPIIMLYQKAIQDENPDLILINGTYFMPWCLLRAAERENVPAVLHYHGVLTKETQNWKKHQKELFYQMEKSFDKKEMFYIFPSKITKDTVEREVFFHRIKKFSILPNPVSDHFFSDKNRRKKKNIGIVSRWTGIKNVKFCEKLAEYNQKQGAKFVVNIITDLNAKNKKYKKLSKVVRFHKPTSNKRLASFYRNMGVVISPSHFETYGNVAKEALASGTPAIVNPNMGVSETFHKLGLSEWIIKFDSVKSVYIKIESLMGETVDQKTRDKMKKLYMPPKIFNEIVSILNNAVI